MSGPTFRRTAVTCAAAITTAAAVLTVQAAAPAAPGAKQSRASGATTYYVSNDGSDANSGRSPGAPWRTLDRLDSARLGPADHVLFERGSRFTDRLLIRDSGAWGARIVVAAYGDGAPPTFTDDCVRVEGSWVRVEHVRATGCDWAGFSVVGDRVKVRWVEATDSVTGVHIGEEAERAVVTHNEIADNTRMSVNTRGGDDDSGAFGVLVNGDHARVAWNRITGHHARSYDYGTDGAAVEIYKATGTRVTHNIARDNHSFTELGHPTTSNTLYSYNLVTSSLEGAHFLVTRGAESGWGPVLETRAQHNTVHNSGAGSEGFICHAGCSPRILTLHANIISSVKKVGYADGPYAGGHNIFSGGQIQFQPRPSDLVRRLDDAELGLGRTSAGRSSPAVDRLPPARGRDVFANRRPRDGDGDGRARLDIGAIER